MDQQPAPQSGISFCETKGNTAYRILVVDDEPSFSAILSEILRSLGYTVQQAHSVPVALQVIGEEIPDLILTDIMMPGIDGLTLVRTLRDDPVWESIPTIVVTAKSHPSDVDETYECGADACLVKPFSASELRTTVQSFLP